MMQNEENTLKILAIDDEYRLLQGLVATVRQVLPDAEVVNYSDVNRANKEVDPKEIDIALLDIEMRGMNGTEYAKILRDANPMINIIFTTGYSEYTGKAMELHASGYIMKPVTPEKLRKELTDLRYPLPSGSYDSTAPDTPRHGTGSAEAPEKAAAQPPEAGLTGRSKAPGTRTALSVRTFGNFEVYVNNTPLSFCYSSKTRELLAYLIDRQGALCSNGELIGILWDDADDPERKISYLKNLRLDLISTLARHGLDDLIIRQRGRIGIAADSQHLDCDYYDWLKKKEGAPSFRGEYMEQYSWAEYTKGGLERAAGIF